MFPDAEYDLIVSLLEGYVQSRPRTPEEENVARRALEILQGNAEMRTIIKAMHNAATTPNAYELSRRLKPV